MRMLRPDLANPSFQEELKSLLEKEEERVKGYKEVSGVLSLVH